MVVALAIMRTCGLNLATLACYWTKAIGIRPYWFIIAD